MPTVPHELNSKRSFLKLFMFLVSGLIGLIYSWGIVRFVFSGTRLKRDRTLSQEMFDLINRDEPYFVPQSEVWVIKGHDELDSIALSDRCTHLGCRYKWNLSKGLFECPCHGSEFDIQGRVLRGPATKPLSRFYLSRVSDQMLRISEQPSTK
ncbi:MAG: ubiquinol-cytochrome c reductase iron-sulfur subunit [Desulfomonilaceae bacterium]